MIISIFGIGRSGLSAAKLAKSLGNEVYAIDRGPVSEWKNSSEIIELLGEKHCVDEAFADSVFNFSELVVLSPGISRSHPQLQRVHERKIELIGEIEFASRFCKISLIAVTGSNGKTTTCTRIAESLKKAGKKVFLCGNIGVPLSELALSQEDFDYGVVELSSFQLESIKTFHPKVSVFLNFYPTHFERYQSMDDYAKAKWEIVKNLTEKDLFIGAKGLPLEEQFVKDLKSSIEIFDPTSFDGPHSEINFYVARKILEFLGISNAKDIIKEMSLTSFPLPHRLETLGEKRGHLFINDAKSTNLASTLAACGSFQKSRPIYLIFGGQIRDQKNYRTYFSAEHWAKTKTTPHSIALIGESAEQQKEILQESFPVSIEKTLEQAFHSFLEKPPGVILFSPGHPSFDQFKNFEERGELFTKMYEEL